MDVESLEDGRKLYKRLPRTEAIALTARGVHLYFRTSSEIRPRVKATVKGIQADIRAECSYVLIPPSLHPSGARYRWVQEWDKASLPEFKEDWIEDGIQRKCSRGRILRIRRYLNRVESIQGQNGSRGLVRAAAICRDNDLSEAEAMVELFHWNRLDVVQPEWSEGELARAVTNTYRKGNER